MSALERTQSVEGLGSVGEERAALATVSSATPTAPPVAPDVWTAPEPWPKRLLRAGKVWVIATITHYSVTQLMGLAGASFPRAVGQSVFMGFWAATISFVGSRKGSLMPASPMLVFGGVTVGLTLLAGGAMLVAGIGARVSEFGAIVSIGLFLGGAMLWMGFRARRDERALAEGEKTERVAPVLVTRTELASRLEAIQQHNAGETKRFMKRLMIGGAVVMGLLAFPYARVFGADLPDAAGFAIFFGMWGAFGLLARATARRARAIAEQYGLICAACDQTYHGGFVNHRYLTNIVEIGRCPRCGARIVTEDGK